jgi:hypothetical protein
MTFFLFYSSIRRFKSKNIIKTTRRLSKLNCRVVEWKIGLEVAGSTAFLSHNVLPFVAN